MPTVTFNRHFNFDHRPKKAVCQTFEASDTPQSVPTHIAEAAIKAGAAVAVEQEERAQVGRKRAE